MRKKIKVKFTGFWPGFDENNNFIINPLRKKYDVILSSNPQYLFSSCFNDDYLDYECIRIFYTGENLCPDFNAFDYAIGFEHMQYGDRYIRYPLYVIPEIYGEDYDKMTEKHRNAEETAKAKTDFCSFVVSKGSGYVAKERELFFNKLSEYKKVNSGGRFLNNIGEKDGVKDKLAFQSKHKFAIAFENSSHVGYSTEKIVQAFAAKTIPIYWGDPNISEIFNEASFVNCHKFESLDEVVEIVRKIDQDDKLYLSMLAEPAIRGNRDIKQIYNEKLECFLSHIVESDIKKAYRRDLVGYNMEHVDKLKEMRQIERSFYRKIVKTIRKAFIK